MRWIFLTIVPLLFSCSLIFQHEEKVTPPSIPSSENHVSISVAPETYSHLLTDDYSTEKFPVVVSYNGGGFCEGTIRLRGQTTLEMYPRSFALDLRQDSAITLHNTALPRFSLIPFRDDTNFVYSLMGLYFSQLCDLFAPEIDLVTVSVNSIEQSTYLLIEHSTDAMVRKDPSTEFVIRRRYGAFYDLKYYEPKDSLQQLSRGDYATSYETLHTLYALYEGENLIKALEERMDLTAYLRVQGLNLIFANGDYHDEIFYAGSARRETNQPPHPYFTFSVWDLSDLFSEPHHGNFTPGSLIYCNENRFDRMIEGTPYLYKTYCQQVQILIETIITEEHITACKLYIDELLNKGGTGTSIKLGLEMYNKEEVLTLFDATVTLLQSRKRTIQAQLNALQ